MRCVAVFCKRPRPGRVKTRLAASIGDATAAGLYEAFLRDTIATCRSLRDTRLAISFAPADGVEYFAALAPGAHLLPQAELEFGARVEALFRELHALGHDHKVVIGGDTPHLTGERITQAFGALETHDGVLGPAADGGYYLLGLRAARAELFADIDWSSDAVARQTRERAAEANVSLALLEPEIDVDDWGSLVAMIRLARERGGETCGHTLAFLAQPQQAELWARVQG